MRCLVCMLVTLVATIISGAVAPEQGRRADDGLSVHRVPLDVIAVLGRLQSAGQLDKARALVDIQRKQYPWDPGLPRIGWQIAFLQGRYADIVSYTDMPHDFQIAYPFVWQTLFEGWDTRAIFYVATMNGVKTPLDPKELEAEILKEAWAKREGLPFGMVTEEGVHVDKQVLTLLLLRDSFGGSHRKLLFERAAKLAPNDTFILELKAKHLIDDGEEAQAVEMYKKAIKAKASEERVKHLRKALAEAEKLAEWRKRVGPRTDKKGGG